MLPFLQLALAPADLFLGAAKLGGGCGLCVPFDRVGHLGGGADHVQRIHPDGVAGWFHLPAPGGRLEYAQLDLKLRRMPPEGLERLLDAVRVEATVCECREFLDARERCQ